MGIPHIIIEEKIRWIGLIVEITMEAEAEAEVVMMVGATVEGVMMEETMTLEEVMVAMVMTQVIMTVDGTTEYYVL
jgi:hypothetical protein